MLRLVDTELLVLLWILEDDQHALVRLHTLHFVLPDLKLLGNCIEASLLAQPKQL